MAILVACLCAEWCTSCRAYRQTFDAVASAHPDVRFVWVDIEDDEALVEDLDVDNFPTLLIGRESVPHFYGVVLPHGDTLSRLVSSAREGAVTQVAEPAAIAALLARLQERERGLP